jgi:ubiquinone/menaquinone biosynthesis C-methylase UbiE
MIRRKLAKGMRLASGQPNTPDSQWFWDHYDGAAAQIAEFAESAGVSLTGRDVADIGCGEGIMALGLCRRVHPRRLVGFDIVPVAAEHLLTRAQQERADSSMPAELEFRTSTPTGLPAGDDEFDFVYSWSAFEHIEDPVGVLREIRRILRPTGHFFLQLWPFHRSAKGSHLWDWFPEDFHHLLENERDTVAKLEASDRHSPDWTAYMTREFEHLNRVTPDELQRSLLAAGFDVRKVELMTSPFHLTPSLQRYPWTELGISGIKLIALPQA